MSLEVMKTSMRFVITTLFKTEKRGTNNIKDLCMRY